ncbi:phosphoglycerate mutase family protein [uncultured Bacteroides sp.]|uniref:phosphoglycerate mutase family protein n=1 Tax=uncultured Bacteroides sp. TaxID=162156 RepID=UPI0025F4FA2F|nr:phosphoglycerate mutase family protein [uncultured Bacteroides sp.]
MENILEIARRNQQKAWEIVEKTNIIPIWESIGARINMVGSLRTGLLMKHRDIDFHIYTSSLTLADSFRAMAELAENTSVKKIECANLLHTVEECVEWHAWYQDTEGELWQIDMIHIRENSRYDGYFEKVAERISAVLTDETKRAILNLKYETPDTEKIMGVEYYQAVIRDGVRSYPEFEEWRRLHPVTGVIEWIP